MQLEQPLKNKIEQKLREKTGKNICIKKSTPVHGGDIHQTFHLETNNGSFFLKVGENIPADLFEKEYNGLTLLQEQDTIAIAEPLAFGNAENQHFLLLEYIDKAPANATFWDTFAKGLSELHRCTNQSFGLNEDNYIGPLPQPNQQHGNWPDFYIAQRLQPLIRQCIDQQLLEKNDEKNAKGLYKQMESIFPKEPPALLHGDLWGGNYLCGQKARPYLFDPAVYYGNREMDLAMTRLFGGFDRQFYWHYEEYFPLAEGWQKRIPLCQLYPLLVHSLLFGGGYVQQVKRILEEYGR